MSWIAVARSGVVALVLSCSATAQCLDFEEGFGANGVAASGLLTGRVGAMEEFDDGSGPALWVGGAFSVAGEVATTALAKWDGASWSAPHFPSGQGFVGPYGGPLIRDLLVFDDGGGARLYVAGLFEFVDGRPATYVVRTDGTSWDLLPGIPAPTADAQAAHALAVFDDGAGPALYVGGYFPAFNAASSSGIAKWSGAAWTPLPSGISGLVYELDLYDDGAGPRLIAGGSFTPGNLAAWDGASFTVIGGGTNGAVEALEVFDGGAGPELYVGGSFGLVAGVSMPRLVRWDGAAWSSFASPPANPQDLIAFDDGAGPALYLSAFAPAVTRLVGAQWLPIGDATGRCYDLHAWDDGSGSSLYVGGDFVRAGSQRADRIAKLSGGLFTPVSTSNGRSLPLEALEIYDDGSGAALYADTGGYLDLSSGVELDDGVARWEGASWTPLGGAADDDVLVLRAYAGELYAGGLFSVLGGVASGPLARWNGAAWATVGGGLGGASPKVYAVEEFDFGSGPALVVGGNFQTAGGVQARRVAVWDGTTWSALGDGFNALVQALAVFDDGGGPRLYAGGRFTASGATSISYIALWSGAAWLPLGIGVNDFVEALGAFDGIGGPQLYVSGRFTLVDGSLPLFGFARWNGSAWSAVPGVSSATAKAFAIHDGGLGRSMYVGGSLALTGSSAASHLARFDGALWSDLVVDGPVNALASLERPSGLDSLFAAGDFVFANGRPSLRIAEWAHAWGCPPVSYCTAGTTTNGCAAHVSAIGAPSASAGSGFVLSIGDVEGDKYGLVFYGVSGRAAAPWGATTSTLCVKSPVQRTGVLLSGGAPGSCDGSFALDWNAWVAAHPTSIGAPFSAGRVVTAQAWLRDPPSAKTTALSDALEFYVAP